MRFKSKYIIFKCLTERHYQTLPLVFSAVVRAIKGASDASASCLPPPTPPHHPPPLFLTSKLDAGWCQCFCRGVFFLFLFFYLIKEPGRLYRRTQRAKQPASQSFEGGLIHSASSSGNTICARLAQQKFGPDPARERHRQPGALD